MSLNTRFNNNMLKKQNNLMRLHLNFMSKEKKKKKLTIKGIFKYQGIIMHDQGEGKKGEG